MKTMPDGVIKKIQDWFQPEDDKHADNYKILHFWEQDGTYFIAVYQYEMIAFVRIWNNGFPLGNKNDWVISVDNSAKLD